MNMVYEPISAKELLYFFSISSQNVVYTPTSILNSTHVHQPFIKLEKFFSFY